MSLRISLDIFYDFIIIQNEHKHSVENNFLYDPYVSEFKIKPSRKTKLQNVVSKVLAMLIYRKKGR